MKTVKIGKLKAQLSAHLRRVRRGEEVLVYDRAQPVARIVPVQMEDPSKRQQRLVARGVLAPPLKNRAASARWPKPPGDVSAEAMERVWREERESR